MLSNWQQWCRLCGKCETADDVVKQESFARTAFIAEKYFSIIFSNPLKSICTECRNFLTKLDEFGLRCAKVNSLFNKLVSSGEDVQFDENYLQSLRYEIGLDGEEKIKINAQSPSQDKTTDTDDLGIVEYNVEHAEVNGDNEEKKRPRRVKKESKTRKSGRKSTRVKAEEIPEIKNEEMEIEALDYDDDDDEGDPTFLMNSDQENNIKDDSDEYVDDGDLIDPNELTDSPPRKRRRQRKSQQSPKNVSLNCPLCNIHFDSKRLFDTHMRERHPKSENPFSCSKCPKRFQSLAKLQRHENIHLPDELKLVHPCEYCDKRFSKLVNVQAHIRAIHTRDRPFICEECGKSFVANGALKEHQVTHSNEFPFQCAHCPKKFKNMARLRTHEDIHTHTAYICPHCGLQLNTKRTLKMHMVVHSDQKKYKCQYCGNEYKRSKALKNHLILHTGLRPYTCPFCEKTFANGSNCRSHKKKAHPVELAALEASGEVLPAANIPKLEMLQPKKPPAPGEQSLITALIATQTDSMIVENVEYN